MRDGEALLEVRVGARICGISTGCVAEILRADTAPLTRVPNTPASLLGVANLRGAMLPVLSLARLLGLVPVMPTRAARVVVIDRAARLGLLVDAVTGQTQSSTAPALDIDGLVGREFAAAGGRYAREKPPPGPGDAPVAAASAAALDVAVLGMLIAGQAYGWPMENVEAVLAVPDITAVAGSDAVTPGAIAWRGGALPVASLRALLGLPATERASGPLVVARLGPARFGLLVDALTGILRIPRAAIDPVPALLARGRGEARIAAIARIDDGRRLVCLLSPDLLFDAATTARVLTQGDRAAASVVAAVATAQGVRPFVIFRLDAEFYGLPIGAVSEVVRRPDRLTWVPLAPGFVAGVVNLNGRALPIIYQGARFATQRAEGARFATQRAEGARFATQRAEGARFATQRAEGARGRMIVVAQSGGLRAGFAVDAVLDVLDLAQAPTLPLPALADGGGRLFDHAVQDAAGRTILLIEPGALLNGTERDLLAAFATRSAGRALAE